MFHPRTSGGVYRWHRRTRRGTAQRKLPYPRLLRAPDGPADRDWRRSSVSRMNLDGEYEPSPARWVRDQVEAYESSGGQRANTLRDTGLPIIIITTRGNKTGKIRKTPLMRVEHDGQYLLVGSKGGSPAHPVWYYNLKADPQAVMLQDGPEPFEVSVRELSGEERATWWQRAVRAFPPYADYEARTDRTIPVFLASRRS
jgi:deazaflavin-dependent oxidoreductase (nitroreductase family)